MSQDAARQLSLMALNQHQITKKCATSSSILMDDESVWIRFGISILYMVMWCGRRLSLWHYISFSQVVVTLWETIVTTSRATVYISSRPYLSHSSTPLRFALCPSLMVDSSGLIRHTNIVTRRRFFFFASSAGFLLHFVLGKYIPFREYACLCVFTTLSGDENDARWRTLHHPRRIQRDYPFSHPSPSK